MSISKRLAAYCMTDADRVDRVVSMLDRYQLQALMPHLQRYCALTDAHHARTQQLVIRSAYAVDEALVADVKARLHIAASVPVVIETDPKLIQGIEVYYQGSKWSDSVQGKLARFVAPGK